MKRLWEGLMIFGPVILLAVALIPFGGLKALLGTPLGWLMGMSVGAVVSACFGWLDDGWRYHRETPPKVMLATLHAGMGAAVLFGSGATDMLVSRPLTPLVWPLGAIAVGTISLVVLTFRRQGFDTCPCCGQAMPSDSKAD